MLGANSERQTLNGELQTLNLQDAQGFSAAALSPAIRPKAIASGMLLPPG
jgi:hypothetical protein